MIYSYHNSSFVNLDLDQGKVRDYASENINSDIDIKVILRCGISIEL
jgi:hypothetical protein